jgi:hypothetical protein
MRKLGKTSYAIKMKDGNWALVRKGKVVRVDFPSADAAESAYSDKEGKR